MNSTMIFEILGSNKVSIRRRPHSSDSWKRMKSEIETANEKTCFDYGRLTNTLDYQKVFEASTGRCVVEKKRGREHVENYGKRLCEHGSK